MPIGSFSCFGKIVQSILATNPKSVLDLGIGFGMNGAAVRNWLDLGTKEAHGGKWSIKLEGVEAFEKYRNPAWDLYDKVHVSEIRKFLDKTGQTWDLIIMTDVIEHFFKAEGEALLEQLKGRCNKAVVVSTPAVWAPQGAVYGNELETHRSVWSKHDFVHCGYGIVKDGDVDEFGHRMLIADYVRK